MPIHFRQGFIVQACYELTVSQVGFELLILLPSSPKDWDAQPADNYGLILAVVPVYGPRVPL